MHVCICVVRCALISDNTLDIGPFLHTHTLAIFHEHLSSGIAVISKDHHLSLSQTRDFFDEDSAEASS